MADSNAGNYRLITAPGAEGDLVECRAVERITAARIFVFLRTLDENPEYAERVIDVGYADHQIEDVCVLKELDKRRINGYRIRCFDWDTWRLIFVVDRPTGRIGLFSVMPRADDYPDVLMDRIEREFDELGFTRY